VTVPVPDRGEVVAVLVGPDAVPLRKRAKRVLLTEYVKLILEGPLSDDGPTCRRFRISAVGEGCFRLEDTRETGDDIYY
jgi:hypothetical protein